MTIGIGLSGAFLHNIRIGIGSGNTPLQRTVYFCIFVFVVKLIVLFQSGKLDYMQHLNLIFFLYFSCVFLSKYGASRAFSSLILTSQNVEKCSVLSTNPVSDM